MAVILTFASATAELIAASNPTLFGTSKLNCFDFFAFAMSSPPEIFQVLYNILTLRNLRVPDNLPFAHVDDHFCYVSRMVCSTFKIFRDIADSRSSRNCARVLYHEKEQFIKNLGV